MGIFILEEFVLELGYVLVFEIWVSYYVSLDMICIENKIGKNRRKFMVMEYMNWDNRFYFGMNW